MEIIQQLIQILLHIDTYLVSFVSTYGAWTYAVLFMVIFCETGLVIMPFLPGDSLLFAAGSIAAHPQSTIKISLLFLLLCIASILGNKVNYLVGRFIGPRVFKAEDSWLLNKQYLNEAHRFYSKHGGKTIIFARFLPIIRTFAPFVAGVGYMSLRSFSFYNLFSGILWVGSLLAAGFFFGSLPIIKENFTIVIYLIIAVSILPALYAALFRRKTANS